MIYRSLVNFPSLTECNFVVSLIRYSEDHVLARCAKIMLMRCRQVDPGNLPIIVK